MLDNITVFAVNIASGGMLPSYLWRKNLLYFTYGQGSDVHDCMIERLECVMAEERNMVNSAMSGHGYTRLDHSEKYLDAVN